MFQPTELPILFHKYPHLRKQIAWLPLGQLPTPVHRLTHLGHELGFDSLWIKRDDLSGLLGGGNKVRKLEYLLADARQKGYETLFTVGPKGSNHVRATIEYGKAVGFRCHCLLFDQPQSEFSETNFQHIRMRADKVHTTSSRAAFIARYGQETFIQFTKLHRNRYFLPPGGSSPIGCIGYVNAAFELKAQIDAGILPEPTLIFVALGTCGTMAGLIVGAKLAGLKSRIIGVRVVDRIVANVWSVARLARKTLKLIRVPLGEMLNRTSHRVKKIKAREIEIWGRDFGRGYAIPTEASLHAIQIMQEYEGIRLESTYTGKTLAGLIHCVKAQGYEKQPILFWNTYGHAGEISNRDQAVVPATDQ